MSRDFASFMESISGDSAETKIKELMEILDKVMMIVMNSVDNLSVRLQQIEMNIQNMTARVVKLENMPRTPIPAPAAPAAPGAPVPAPAAAAPPPPKPAPKPMAPMSARAALQSELKSLFARRKKQ